MVRGETRKAASASIFPATKALRVSPASMIPPRFRSSRVTTGRMGTNANCSSRTNLITDRVIGRPQAAMSALEHRAVFGGNNSREVSLMQSVPRSGNSLKGGRLSSISIRREGIGFQLRGQAPGFAGIGLRDSGGAIIASSASRHCFSGIGVETSDGGRG